MSVTALGLTGSSNAIYINNSTGFVGVGKSNPTSALDVVGTISVGGSNVVAPMAISKLFVGPTGNSSMIIQNNGKLQAWGWNNAGQMGNGTTTNIPIPTSISSYGSLAGKTITAVACGYNHTIALDSTGALHSWGDNGSGRLGNGTTTSSNTPALINTSGTLSGKTIIAVACGEAHSVALDSTGAIHTWGYNAYGQLGNGNNSAVSTPAMINTSGSLSGKTIIMIATGGHNVVAVDSAYGVHTWGYNNNGELGKGTSGATNSSTPALINSSGVLSGKTITAVACGYDHILVLDNTGSLYAWGYNSSGQVGNSTTTSVLSPISISSFGTLSGKTITSIACGGYHSLVLDSTGALHIWGLGNTGQTGNGTANNSTPALINSPGTLSGKTLTAVTAGNGFSFALDSTGTLHAFGYNNDYELGNNLTANSLVPINIMSFGTLAAAGAPVFMPAAPAASASAAGVVLPDNISTVMSNGILAASAPFRNRVINGNMIIDQRNSATTAITSNGIYAMDRFIVAFGLTSGSVSFSQVATPATLSGFTKCARLVGSSINVSSNDNYLSVVQIIEGQNIADFMWGTPLAQPVTLSFWVYCTATGTYSAGIRNSGVTRSYQSSYTINAANKWQQVVITIPGDTTISSTNWPTDNTGSISVYISFASSSNLSTAAGNWVAGNYIAVNGISNLGSNTVYLTGVQLEKGSIATPFEFRPLSVELQLCQRYYQKSYDQAVAPGTVTTAGSVSGIASTSSYINWFVPLNPRMRSSPTATIYNPQSGATGSATNGAGSYPNCSIAFPGESAFNVQTSGASSLNWYYLHYTASAEL